MKTYPDYTSVAEDGLVATFAGLDKEAMAVLVGSGTAWATGSSAGCRPTSCPWWTTACWFLLS